LRNIPPSDFFANVQNLCGGVVEIAHRILTGF